MSKNLETTESKSHITGLLSFLQETLYIKGNVSFDWFLENTDYLNTIRAARNHQDKFEVKKTIVSINKSDIINNIDDYLKTVTHFFIRSIITGEYISEKDFNQKVKAIGVTIENYFQDFIYVEDENKFTDTVFKDLNFILKNNFINVGKELVDNITTFVKSVSQIGVDSSLDIIHSFKTEDLNLNLTKKNQVYLRNLLLTLGVYYLDHTLEEDGSYINNLFDIQTRLDNCNKSPDFICLPILSIKLNFLKQKWFLRSHKNIIKNENHSGLHKVLEIDNKIISFHENFDFIGGNDKLISWIKEINIHYNLNKSFFPNRQSPKLFSTSTNKQLRELIKYYKDIKKNPQILLEIIEEIQLRANKDSRFNLNLLYAKNCLLSLYIKNDYSDDFIKETYTSILSLQEKFNIKNFFADLKILDLEVTRILNIINNYSRGIDTSTNNIASIDYESLESRLFSLWELFYDSCKYNRFLYFLPYEESCVESDSKDVEHVYYHSSIFLPIAYSDNYNKIQTIEKNIEKIKAYITSFELVQNDLDEIKIIKEETKDSNKRIIEIVSMFTAIISFILGSVGAFSFIETFSQALLFITLYGTCISIFVVLFYFMNRGFKLKLQHVFIIIPYLLIASILYSYLLPIYQNDVNNTLKVREEKIINRKLDSIQNINNEMFIPITEKE